MTRKTNQMNPIKTEADYEKASERADEIFTAQPNTPEHAELKELLKALKEYEKEFIDFLKGYDGQG